MPSLGKMIRRLRYGTPIVVVSGLPRSGTSMAMKMLEAAGMEMVVDGVRTADEDNPKGYFEDERVMDLAQTQDKTWLNDARGKSVKIIAFLLSHLPLTHNYRVIFMNRDIEEVLASQKKMLDRRGETSDTSDGDMITAYQQNLERVRFLLRYRDCFETLEVSYRDVIENPETQAQRIADFIGRPQMTQKMAEVVDPDLYRNRSN